MNLWTIFLTGLVTGGLTCLAVQGGLLAATLAQTEEERLKYQLTKTGKAIPILSFLITKFIAYSILGFLLGWFGAFFEISLTTKIIMQLVIGIFMVGTALNLLQIHPIFRYFLIQPPKFLFRFARNQSKSKEIYAPALLGALTIFIPCGTTQAMMALSIASGNPVTGATILAAFILGTSPLFFILGYFTTRLGDRLHAKFMNFAAWGILLLAVFNINNSIALTGSDFTLENMLKESYCLLTSCSNRFVLGESAPAEEATINISRSGYTPERITVKAGSHVTLNLVNNGGGGCTQAFTIPQYGIQKIVRRGTSDTVSFKAPDSPQKIAFMCSMGMFRGTIDVVSDI